MAKAKKGKLSNSRKELAIAHSGLTPNTNIRSSAPVAKAKPIGTRRSISSTDKPVIKRTITILLTLSLFLYTLAYYVLFG